MKGDWCVKKGSSDNVECLKGDVQPLKTQSNTIGCNIIDLVVRNNTCLSGELAFFNPPNTVPTPNSSSNRTALFKKPFLNTFGPRSVLNNMRSHTQNRSRTTEFISLEKVQESLDFSAASPTAPSPDLVHSFDSRQDDFKKYYSTDSGITLEHDKRPPRARPGSRNRQIYNNKGTSSLIDASKDFDLNAVQASLDEKISLQRRGNYFKSNSLRSGALSEKTSRPPSNTGLVESDLIATGTLVNSTNSRNQKNSFSFGNGQTTNSSSTMNGNRRVFSRPAQLNTTQKQKQINETKYCDPLSGSEPSFQQRLAELATLEADTVRWERAKKLKKKAKDNDS